MKILYFYLAVRMFQIKFLHFLLIKTNKKYRFFVNPRNK
ncbi:hypothetical protein GW13_PRO3649 [Salmonella enterica subsp. enterica serovar Cerro]|nr:hypothetical protein GW13_PRO3649 [Salmonella enterica subsp. enterica serovar Cerro]